MCMERPSFDKAVSIFEHIGTSLTRIPRAETAIATFKKNAKGPTECEEVMSVLAEAVQGMEMPWCVDSWRAAYSKFVLGQDDDEAYICEEVAEDGRVVFFNRLKLILCTLSNQKIPNANSMLASLGEYMAMEGHMYFRSKFAESGLALGWTRPR